MTEPPFPSTSASQTPNPPFSTTKNSGPEKCQNQRFNAHPVLGQGRAWTRGDIQRSGVGPPLSSNGACLHTAFIAFSVHCVSGWRFNVRWQRVPSSLHPTWPGRETRPVGSRHYHLVPPGHRSKLRCGFCLCAVLACPFWAVRAVAGLTRPHTLRMWLTKAWGGWGGGEVRGHTWLPLSPLRCVVLVLGAEKPPSGYWLTRGGGETPPPVQEHAVKYRPLLAYQEFFIFTLMHRSQGPNFSTYWPLRP